MLRVISSSRPTLGGFLPVPERNLIVIPGDSNGVGQGDLADVDNGPGLDVAFAAVQMNTRYAVGTADPPTWFDYPTDDLASRQPAGAAGFGVELTLGRELYRNGTLTPVIGKIAVSGADTTHFNGFLADDLIDYITDLQTETGEELGAIVLSLGTNDGNNATNAANFAANLTTLMTAIRTEFGSHVVVALIETPSTCIEAHTATVRTQALAYVASDPKSALVYSNDLPLPDGRHFEGNSYATLGQRAAFKVLDLMGQARYSPAASVPEVVGAGLAEWGTGTASGGVALTPRSWPGCVDGDIELLIVSTGNVDNAPALLTAEGFVAVAGAAQSSDLAGNKQRHDIWQRPVLQATLDANGGIMPSPVVQDTNSYLAAKIFTIRASTETPEINATAGAVNNAYNTTLALTGVTTDAASCLVLSFVTGYSAAADNDASPANGSLTSLAIYQSSTLDMGGGNFRILAVASGVKAVAGATGTTTITMDTSAVLAGATIAVEP